MSRIQELKQVVDWLMREHYKFLVNVNGRIQAPIEETQHSQFLFLISTARDEIKALEDVTDKAIYQIREYDPDSAERFDRT